MSVRLNILQQAPVEIFHTSELAICRFIHFWVPTSNP